MKSKQNLSTKEFDISADFRNSLPFSENVEECSNSPDVSQFSNESEAVSVDEEPKLPILKKIGDISDKIQVN